MSEEKHDSTRFSVLVCQRITEEAFQYLKSHNVDVFGWKHDFLMPRETFLELVRNHRFDGILVSYHLRVDDEVLEEAGEQLRVISTHSVGYNHIDINACKRRNIPVAYTPDVLTETMADTTLGLMIGTARRFPEALRDAKTSDWSLYIDYMAGKDVHHSTVGIVGLGRIGMAVARRLHFGFGCDILYTTSSGPKCQASLVNAEYVSLDELLARSDFVVLLCALTPQTHKMFTTDTFGKMKKDAIFINMARGAIVDHDALLQALQTGTIRAAGLDVTDPEPLPVDHPLHSLPNCMILPHIGSASLATRNEMSFMAVQGVLFGMGMELNSQIHHKFVE